MSLKIDIIIILTLANLFCSFADEVARPMTKFNAQVSQGAALVDFPIALPTGAGGFKPDLKFSYNSDGANGLLGIGWQISPLHKITVTGKTLYFDGTIEPIGTAYLLDGDRLIEVKKDKDTIFYRKFIDDNTHVAKFNNGKTFRVNLPNGNEQFYEELSATPNLWVLQLERDKNHNEIIYSWKCSEKETPRIYEIIYNQKGDSENKVSVLFSYISRNDTLPILYSKNLIKDKYLLSNINVMLGSNLYRNYTLTYDKIDNKSVLKQVVEKGANGESLPPYSFYWNLESTSHQIKSKISSSLDYLIDKNSTNWTFADYDDDGEKELVYWEESIVKFYKKNSDGKYVYNHQMNAPKDWHIIQPIFGCFFDPHRTNILIKFRRDESDKVYVGDLSTQKTLLEKPFDFAHIVADIDNDGCDEFIGYNQYVWINDWNNDYSDYSGYLPYIPGVQILVSDFNGDGLLDIASINNCTNSIVNYFTQTLDVDGWAYIEIFTNTGVSENGKISFSLDKSIKFDDMHINLHAAADFNGDGLSDILFGIMDGKLDKGVKKSMYEYENKQGILYNRGSLNFEEKRLVDSYDIAYPFTEKENNENDIKVGDFNGDGKADILFLSSRYVMKSDASRNSDENGVWGEWKDATIAFYTSIGESFKLVSKKTITDKRLCFLKSSIQIYDLNNNGISEAVHFMGYDLLTLNESGRSGYFTEFNKENLKPYLRTMEQRVLNSMVDYFVFYYSPLSSLRSDLKSNDYKGNMEAYQYFGDKTVVSAMTTNNLHFSYKYGPLYYNKTGRGSIGFLKEIETNETSKIITQKEIDYSKPSLQIYSFKEAVFAEDGKQISLLTKNNLIKKIDDGYGYRVSPSRFNQINYLNNTHETIQYKDMNVAYLPQTIVTQKGLEGGTAKTEKITYNDLNGGTGLLKQKVSTYWTSSEDSSSTNLKSEVYYSYDNKDRLIEIVSKPVDVEEMKVSIKYDSFGNVVQLDSISSDISKKIFI